MNAAELRVSSWLNAIRTTPDPDQLRPLAWEVKSWRGWCQAQAGTYEAVGQAEVAQRIRDTLALVDTELAATLGI